MKISSLISVIILALLVSCKKDASRVSTTTIELQKGIVTSDTWRVTSFVDKGIDQTSDFSTYLFQFNSEGSAVATSTGIGILYFGSWNLRPDVHIRINASGKTTHKDTNRLKITLTGHYHMDEISNDWAIERLTDRDMWLMVDNMVSFKEIHFTKNL